MSARDFQIIYPSDVRIGYRIDDAQVHHLWTIEEIKQDGDYFEFIGSRMGGRVRPRRYTCKMRVHKEYQLFREMNPKIDY